MKYEDMSEILGTSIGACLLYTSVEAVILTLDRDERKMSLGIKQLKQDP